MSVLSLRRDDRDCYWLGDRNLPCIHPFRRREVWGWNDALWLVEYGPDPFPPERAPWWAAFLPW